MLFQVSFNGFLIQPGFPDQAVLCQAILIITTEFLPSFTFCPEKSLLGFRIDYQ